MALLDWTDFENQTNRTLSDPDGRAFADHVAGSILAWSARYGKRSERDDGRRGWFAPLSPWPDAFMAEVQRDATERLAAILGQR